MHWLKISILSSLVALLSVIFYINIREIFYIDIVKPKTLEEKWWGPGSPKNESSEIVPFKIKISDEVLEDLKYRLDHTIPFQEPLENVTQGYGISTNFLETFVEFWKTKYNWREREEYLNQYSQYVTRIQGLKVHYLHVKPAELNGVRVIPLLILHGWPGSIREFYDIIPILTTHKKGRDFVFEIVAPSLPGIHLNFCLVNNARAHLKMMISSLLPSFFVEEQLVDNLFPLYDRLMFVLEETGYMHIQGTKPDTLGVALRDSPVGLAAYILEKFSTLTNPTFRDLEDAGFSKKFSFTSLLDNIMIYWVTRTMTSSMRIYKETFYSPHFNLMRIPLADVPTGCARYHNDIVSEPEWILRDKYLNLIYISDHDQGHFAAFEVPETFAEDFYRFVEKVEKLPK